MTELTSASMDDKQPDVTRGGQRPWGVAILAVLHLLGGSAGLLATAAMVLNMEKMAPVAEALAVHPAVLILAIVFLMLLTLASGVGLWLGTRWGWWLAAFYYMYGIFRNVGAVITIPAMHADFETAGLSTDRPMSYYIAKHAGRIVVHLLVMLYLFRPKVLTYFRLSNENKFKAVVTLFLICLAIVLSFTAYRYLFANGELTL